MENWKIYVIGMIIWLVIWFSNGNSNGSDIYVITNHIIYLFVVLVLAINSFFSYKFEKPPENFNDELALYSYVEKNATIMLTISSAIIIYVANSKLDAKYQLIRNLVFGFLASLSVLALLWMPTQMPVLLSKLKHVKTVLLTFGIGFVAGSLNQLLKYHSS